MATNIYKFGGYNGFQPVEFNIGGKKMIARSPEEYHSLNLARVNEVKTNAAMATRPDRPEWESLIGQDGMLQNPYQINDLTNQALSDDVGFNKFQNEAMREGPSKLSQMLLDQQELERKDRIGDINAQYNMASQNAMDSLAGQGGLDSGSRERVAANSMRDLLSARQQARGDFQKQKLNILTDDEQNRVNQLQNLAGMEQNRNQMQLAGKEFDIRNALNERDAARQERSRAYTEDREDWAANQQANAQTSAAGGGGCFPGHTLIELENGSKKRIDEIEVGETIFGGKVTKTICGLADKAQWFDYCGVTVTGDHAVFEDERWVRVKDSRKAKKKDVSYERLYNLSNVDHVLFIDGQLFSDFDEIDESGLSNTDSLNKKNGELCLKIIS